MNEIIKPLVIIDIETTGLSKEKDYIIQISGIKVDRINDNIVDEFNYYVKPRGSYQITIQAYLKHKISPAFLEDKPYFSEIANQILDFISGCDILTYNGISFDLPFIANEFKRIGIDVDFTKYACYDAFLEEKRRNGNSLSKTFERYVGHTMEEDGLTAHDSFSDIKATYKIFQNQQKNKEYGPENMVTEDNIITIEEFQHKELPCFNVGKYKGLPISYVSTVDQGYLKWCVSDKCDFTESTKSYISKYIK